jgi:hypothetical protein
MLYALKNLFDCLVTKRLWEYVTTEMEKYFKDVEKLNKLTSYNQNFGNICVGHREFTQMC